MFYFNSLLSFCKQPVTLITHFFLMKFKFVAEDNNFIHGFKVRVASRATWSERAQSLFLHQFGQWPSKVADLLVDGT